MFCKNCGKEIADNALTCPHCGAPVQSTAIHTANPTPGASPKNWLTTLLLCLFLGTLGIHSFYAGKTLIGIIQLFTGGGCGIWTLVDFIMILVGSYKDGEGRPIVNR